MIHVDLTHDEAALLRQLLESCLSELREEIRHTDTRSFRDMLKAQEASVQNLRQHLAAQDAPLAA
jgi:hypothetical protein